MSISKKILGTLAAFVCATSACVCSISVSAEKVSPVKTSNGLEYVIVDEDEDNINDFVRITGCDSNAESLLIPKAIEDLVVKEVVDGAFCGNTSLISLDVNSQNGYFTAQDGVLFSKNGKDLICYPSAKAAVSYEVPATVTRIADFAFSNCKDMTKINISNSVKEIGIGAFLDCTALKTITIPSSVESIGSAAFIGTEILNEQIRNSKGPLYYANTWLIYADSDVTTVMDASKPIEANTTGIAGGAFSNCNNLTKIDIPSGVLYIGDNTFADCTKLSSVNIPTTVKSIGDAAFYNCSALVEISIPDTISSIGAGIFSDCINLTTVNIPKSISVLPESAFEDCNALLEIDIPSNVKEIEKLAFYNCKTLKKITINNKDCVIKDAPQTFSNDDTAFTGTIYGHESSTAQAYAKTYNRLFELISGSSTVNDGDANGDGKLDVRDAAFVAKMIAQNKASELPINADFNNDGTVNIRDAAAIAKHLASKK